MPMDLRTQASVPIHAPAAKVWEALTSPDLIDQIRDQSRHRRPLSRRPALESTERARPYAG